MKRGVLLVQLGSPRSVSWNDVRAFLVQFLGDPRLVVPAPPGWAVLLRSFIAPLRAFRSAAQYRAIQTEDGLPLVTTTKSFARLLEDALAPEMPVRFAFQHGSHPNAKVALKELVALGCDTIRVVPLYPQFAEATTVSAFDAVAAARNRLGLKVALEGVPHFHVAPTLIEAWVRSIAGAIHKSPRPVSHLVLSFHGYPVRRCEEGDPYWDHCKAMAKRIGEALPHSLGEAVVPTVHVAFQSRFGSDAWLAPSTDSVLRELARSGVQTVAVATPSFTMDNLETLYEIGMEARGVFQESADGDGMLLRCSCPNDDPAWVAGFALDVCREAMAIDLDTLRHKWKALYAAV